MRLPLANIDFHHAEKGMLRAVASFEFAKGIFVFLMGLSALLLVHKDAWVIAESLLAMLHVNTDRHWAQVFLDFADNITDARLWAAAQIAFAYSALRFAEGYGLWKQRTWAKWIAFGSGALLIPLEIRELMRGITLIRSALFAINIAIVIYMYLLLQQELRERRALRPVKAQRLHGSE
jgi:uncharacterized membrane protein (DUF2068 family)